MLFDAAKSLSLFFLIILNLLKNIFSFSYCLIFLFEHAFEYLLIIFRSELETGICHIDGWNTNAVASILKILFRKLRNPLLEDLCYFSVSFLFNLPCSVVRCNFNLCCEFVKFNWTVKKTSNKYFYLLLSRRKQLEFHSNCIYQITSGMQWWLGKKCSNFSSIWKFLLDLFSCNSRHKFVAFFVIFCQNGH